MKNLLAFTLVFSFAATAFSGTTLIASNMETQTLGDLLIDDKVEQCVKKLKLESQSSEMNYLSGKFTVEGNEVNSAISYSLRGIKDAIGGIGTIKINQVLQGEYMRGGRLVVESCTTEVVHF